METLTAGSAILSSGPKSLIVWIDGLLVFNRSGMEFIAAAALTSTAKPSVLDQRIRSGGTPPAANWMLSERSASSSRRLRRKVA